MCIAKIFLKQMEYDQKSDTSTNSLNRRHFAKLHQKIQNKFNDMQRKLEKSRSVDSLLTLNEEFIFKEKRNSCSEDFRGSGEVFKEGANEKQVVKYSIIVEDVEQDALPEEICFNEASVYETESLINFDKHYEFDNVSSQTFFGDHFTTSSES